MQYQDIWQAVLQQLQNSVPKATFNVFFANSHIESIEENNGVFKITIPLPHTFAQKSFQRFQPEIEQILTSILSQKCQLEYSTQVISNEQISQTNSLNKKESKDPLIPESPIKENLKSLDKTVLKNKSKNIEDESSLFSSQTQSQVLKQSQRAIFNRLIHKHNINPDYTFENFAVSPTNEVAFAGASTIAKRSGQTYNPFFIYGDVGVGKTHLMQAVAIRILENSPETKIVYSIGEQFTNEIIEAIRNKKTPQFRNKYRKVDILLIDDIQFIAGKDYVQEEFFHTFNAIRSSGGQVIMTADKPPHEIQYLEARLRSRFEEGLAIDIQAPNFELRTAILLIKAKQLGISISMEIAQLIANRITSIRKLEGFLKKAYAQFSQQQTPITRDVILNMLEKQTDIKNVQQRPFIRPMEIVKAIIKQYSISLEQLTGPRRIKPIVTPRQYAMYLLKADLNLPYKEIGRIFGGRDHSTVMHSVEKISKEVSQSEILQQEFSTLRKQIYG